MVTFFFPPLQEIEVDHYRRVKTEKKSPVRQNSDDVIHTAASVVRMPSMDRGAGDGEWIKGELGRLSRKCAYFVEGKG